MKLIENFKSMTSVERARFLWLIPLFLFVAATYQAKLVYDFNRTLTQGIPIEAQVLDVEIKAMAAQAHGLITLRAFLPGGEAVERRLALPVSLVNQLRGEHTITVIYLPGSGQELVAEDLIRTQLKMAASNLAVSTLGMLLVIFGIAAWIRFLRRSGDPSQATLGESAAAQVSRAPHH